jgi:hypothetical protein
MNNINVSFNDMINGCTCSPLNMADFRKYLMHRYTDELLDFYEWYIDYCKKYKTIEKNQNEKLYKNEIDYIINLYFTEGSKKELNISQKSLEKLLSKSKYSTNPKIFEDVIIEVNNLIQNVLFYEYINARTDNITSFTKIYRILIGIILILIYFVAVGIFCYKNKSRWIRLSLLPLLVYSISLSITSYMGICSILNTKKRTEYMEWEKDKTINKKHKLLIYLNLPIFYKKLKIIEDETLIKLQNKKIRCAILYSLVISIILLIITLIIPSRKYD